MSNFSRSISNFEMLKSQLFSKDFLKKVDEGLIQTGKAFLAFRNEEATIYYNGNQLCNLAASNEYEPTIYNHYLPITRSKTICGFRKKEAYSVEQWRNDIGNPNLSFGDVLPEIKDNLEKEESPESLQASRFYRFSPLNRCENHEIVLLDIEAAFSYTGEKTDRIDLVFYHATDRRLMFVEVKRLSDSRLYAKGAAPAEVMNQLKQYKKRLTAETQQINSQYNNVIDYYNALSGGNLPHIPQESEPLLGLLLVEFTRSKKDTANKKAVQDMMNQASFKMYSIGNTSSVTDATLTAIYKSIK